MKKSKLNLCLISFGILAAMFFVLMPSVTLAGGGGMEGAFPDCEDSEFYTFQKAGGPVFVGNVDAAYLNGNVELTGTLKQGNSCTLTFEDTQFIVSVSLQDFRMLTSKGLTGGRIQNQSFDNPVGCFEYTCLEIIAVGNMKWADDGNSFSSLFVLMPVE